MGFKTAATIQAELNRMAPPAREAMLGTLLAELIAHNNALVADLTALRTQYNGLLTKLDADAGVTDTNYNVLRAMAAPTATTIGDLASR